MGDTDKLHFVGNTPALPKQATIAPIPAVVAARPLDTEQAWETEVGVLGAVLEFAACSYSDWVANLATLGAPKPP
ncbi:hypothetical protein D3C76_818940 [compost metagenome]